MILYNMRNRGPYEYDKFTLNVLQIHNAVTLGELHELKENTANKDALLSLYKELNKVYDYFIGNQTTIGLTEKIYLNSYKLKEI